MALINSYSDLIVYKKAYELSMNIFFLSANFPKEEKYSLTDQIRRSSRSVCTNIAESWAKRRYIKAFVNKLTDSLGEELETEVWINYAKDCKYVLTDKCNSILNEYEEVRKILISIINHPEKFCKQANC